MGPTGSMSFWLASSIDRSPKDPTISSGFSPLTRTVFMGSVGCPYGMARGDQIEYSGPGDSWPWAVDILDYI